MEKTEDIQGVKKRKKYITKKIKEEQKKIEEETKEKLKDTNEKKTKEDEGKDAKQIIHDLLLLFDDIECYRHATIGYMYGIICKKKEECMIKQLYDFYEKMDGFVKKKIAENPELQTKIMEQLYESMDVINKLACAIIMKYIQSLSEEK